MTLAALSLLASAGLLARACALAPKVAPVTATLGGFGVLLLVVLLVRGHEDLLGAALLTLGAAYVLGLLAGHHVLDEGAPLVGAGLLLCGELATWSLEERLRVPASRSLLRARAGAVAVLVLVGLAASALVLVVSSAPAGTGLAWTVLGAAAAVGAIGVAARLASR